MFEEFEGQKFKTILADPPWRFECWNKPHTWLTSDGRWNSSRSADGHYKTMALNDIRNMPVGKLADDDCVLFLWACWPLMEYAFDVIRCWGFSFKTLGFDWVKTLPENPREPRMGLGYWSRANSEVCLLATKGSPKRNKKDVKQTIVEPADKLLYEIDFEEVIAAPIREHSRKPDETYNRIERLVDGPYLELFSRTRREGWSVWGDETDKFIPELKLFKE